MLNTMKLSKFEIVSSTILQPCFQLYAEQNKRVVDIFCR